MKILFEGGGLSVTREEGDPKFYGVREGKGESNFLHYLKTELNKKGFDLIKKRAWKDGHLLDDMQQYLRTKNKSSKTPHVYIISNMWAIRGLEVDWNEGQVYVSMEFDVFNVQPDCVNMVKKLLEVQQETANFTVQN
jgi:hypothetical protein